MKTPSPQLHLSLHSTHFSPLLLMILDYFNSLTCFPQIVLSSPLFKFPSPNSYFTLPLKLLKILICLLLETLR